MKNSSCIKRAGFKPGMAMSPAYVMAAETASSSTTSTQQLPSPPPCWKSDAFRRQH